MSPFFSVIIPTYNRAHMIERAVNSVLSQTYTNFELILIDDGSTDQTKELLSHFKEIQYYKIENNGVSAARNFGVSKSKGKYLCFLDSDDEWLSEKLSLQYNKIESTDCLIVHGEETWYRNGIRVNKKKTHQKSGGDVFNRCTELCMIGPSTVAINKELFLKHGGFREDYPVCEDYDFWLKLACENLIEFIELPIINKFGGHEDQLSTKYIAMDYYRVKSLDWILKNKNLEDDKKNKAKEELLKKVKILINGYIKHNSLENLTEMQKLQDSYTS